MSFLLYALLILIAIAVGLPVIKEGHPIIAIAYAMLCGFTCGVIFVVRIRKTS